LNVWQFSKIANLSKKKDVSKRPTEGKECFSYQIECCFFLSYSNTTKDFCQRNISSLRLISPYCQVLTFDNRPLTIIGCLWITCVAKNNLPTGTNFAETRIRTLQTASPTFRDRGNECSKLLGSKTDSLPLGISLLGFMQKSVVP
jgi:hypothetical protein